MSLRAYQTVDEQTGEVVSKFKYLEGSPRQYRFNGQNGQFNIGGERVLQDASGKPIKSFTIIPIAWRCFEENLFGRGRKDIWAELFFVDTKNCVSTIMINNTSIKEFKDLSMELFYEGISLDSVYLTMTPENITTEKDGQKLSWYVTKLSYEVAPLDKVEELRQFAEDSRVYRADTLTDTAVYKFKSDSFYLPEIVVVPQLEAAHD